jgi:hypothetical protein
MIETNRVLGAYFTLVVNKLRYQSSFYLIPFSDCPKAVNVIKLSTVDVSLRGNLLYKNQYK